VLKTVELKREAALAMALKTDAALNYLETCAKDAELVQLQSQRNTN
jgi:hypothetical protein